MPEFVYTARTLAGEDVAGTITAATKRESLGMLAEQSLFPLHVENADKPKPKWQRKKRITAQVLASTLTQMADLLQNGVPLMRALEILADQATHPGLGKVLADVRDQVGEGASLEEAFASHRDVFNELAISMVRAGAEGAFLEDALKRTADFMELQEELKSRFVGAMFYPGFLAAVGSIVTIVLIVFFVPKFAELFTMLERSGRGLPLITVVLLGLSDVLARYGLVLAAVAAGLVYWLRRAVATGRGRLILDRAKLKIPMAGNIFLGYAVSRFCRILGTLLRNGVPILRALEISSESTGNRVLAQAILKSAENISAGETLSRPLAECGVIPRPVMAMITVAEESNTLDDVLVNIADGIDRKLGRQLDMMVRMVEPLMLLVMGMVIMFVLLGLLLPIFEMSTMMA
ncbi:MAG TPA: type II secretion system F family protein [Thermoguttaceae bacterium]|nr:type II secretion system F family protein [Thermoguttaceae bacterium]